MSRARIASDLLLSIPESASSLDVVRGVYPSSVEASISDYGGDSPSLRIAAGAPEVVMSQEDIQKKIDEWKKYAKDNATGAGFRKANRGRGYMDPRRFALQLSEVAKVNAQRYGSNSLARLAKRLRWVASQSRVVAEKALSQMAGQPEPALGTPVIQKPLERPIEPVSDPGEDTELAPGVPVEYNRDQSWSSQESGRAGGRHRVARESEAELATMARDFLQEYKHTNSLYDDEDLLDQLEEPDIFDAWLNDLDLKGRDPDPDQLDVAWQQATQELAEGEGIDEEEEALSPIAASKKRGQAQNQSAPGGDWFNTVVDLKSDPVMDRYLQKMGDKRAGRTRQARKESLDAQITHALDQCLDEFSGEMLPGEISPEHVKQFIEDRFPEVPWEKVYEAIQEISDPKKRHEDDPKERTNHEASRRKVGSNYHRVQLAHSSPFDDVLVRDQSARSRLRGHREICACCHGVGETREGCCGHCGGSGEAPVNLDGEDLEKKAAVASKLGSLLFVNVDGGNPRVSAADRRALTVMTGSRVAGSGASLLFKHSTDLMRVLIRRGIPYRTVNYRHPRYQR